MDEFVVARGLGDRVLLGAHARGGPGEVSDEGIGALVGVGRIESGLNALEDRRQLIGGESGVRRGRRDGGGRGEILFDFGAGGQGGARLTCFLS